MTSTLNSLRGGSAAASFSSTTCSSSTALNSAVAEEQSTSEPVVNYRKDYEALPFFVNKINMDFKITDGKTTVTTELFIDANPDSASLKHKDLNLDGEEDAVKLLSLQINGVDAIKDEDYEIKPGKLVLKSSALSSTSTTKVTTTVEVIPEENTQLSGLYKSGPMYCTQCEATGFRRITYYPDRPDNMAVFERVRIEADKENYPVLLGNGNLMESGDLEDGRHYSVW
eukprot:1944452-Ditylum_brightwellii.AAC.1